MNGMGMNELVTYEIKIRIKLNKINMYNITTM